MPTRNFDLDELVPVEELPAPPKVAQVQLTGPGVTVTRDVDEDTMARILLLIFGVAGR